MLRTMPCILSLRNFWHIFSYFFFQRLYCFILQFKAFWVYFSVWYVVWITDLTFLSVYVCVCMYMCVDKHLFQHHLFKRLYSFFTEIPLSKINYLCRYGSISSPSFLFCWYFFVHIPCPLDYWSFKISFENR